VGFAVDQPERAINPGKEQTPALHLDAAVHFAHLNSISGIVR
jgi:hypothetical protein